MTVRLVVGPPGAGKTTYVRQKAKPEDLVIDLDEIRRATANPATAEAVRKALEATAAEHPADAWIIRTLADPDVRADFADRHGVDETIVIATPETTARERARTRDGNTEMDEPIARWWATYQPRDGETIIEPDTGDQPRPDKDNIMPKNLTTPDTEKRSDDEEQQTPAHEAEANSSQSNEHGFPAENPVKDMTEAQQAAYWKHQARKHEDKVKALADYEDLKKDAEAFREAQKQGMSDAEKQLEEAKAQARAEIAREFGQKLFQSQFSALAAQRNLSEDARQGILEAVDTSRFISEDGEVDEKRLGAFLDRIAPAAPQPPIPGSSTHGGHRQTQPVTGKALGAALAAQHLKKGR